VNRKEVESVFTVPLKHLIEPDNCKSPQFRYGNVLSVFRVCEHRQMQDNRNNYSVCTGCITFNRNIHAQVTLHQII
jgi:hypothetical protein